MSDEDRSGGKPSHGVENDESGADTARGGLNLWIVYGLMLLGFLVAVGIAILIVMPFYQRR